MSRAPSKPEPAWDIAKLFPYQGHWTEADYLALDTNRLVEFTDGHVEVLPMPTEEHQEIVLFLLETLLAFVRPRGLGKALMAPLRVRLRKGKIREPDIVFLLAERADRRGKQFWRSADLVVEVVSDDDPARDYKRKRRDYAEAGISEYWIADPQKREITVLTLRGNAYDVHGTFVPGQDATSKLLEGFRVSVSDTFAPKD